MRKKLGILFLFCLLGIVMIGCEVSLNGPDSDSLGVIRLTINQGDDFKAKTLIPDIPMDIYDYSISGTGPDSRTFGPSVFSINEDVVIPDLYKGSWNVTVEGRNNEAKVIGKGNKAITIYPSQTTQESITVTPLTGNGTLDLSASWPISVVPDATFVAVLTDKEGQDHVLEAVYGQDGGSATYIGQWASGYYDFSVGLYEGEFLLWGAYESVRIVEGETTFGELALTEADLNLGGNGTLSLTLSSEMQNPFDITLDGFATELTVGSSMTVTSTVVPSGSYEYRWYLNGRAMDGATESSLTFGSTLDLGMYNVSLRVSDGTVLSSTSFSFSVNVPSNVLVDDGYDFVADDSDVIPFTIVGIVPSDGSTDIPVQTGITVYFDDIIDPSSLNAVNMAVSVGGNPIAGQYTLTRSTNEEFAVIHFVPDTLFPESSLVSVVIASENGLTDKGGNTLSSEVTYSFTTGSSFVGDLNNLSFESGITGWQIQGNGGIMDLPFVGSLSMDGNKAIAISTDDLSVYGFSGTPQGGTTSMLISGTLSVPSGATSLLFDYYFLSAEFIEYIGSEFDDTLTLTVSGAQGGYTTTIESVNMYAIEDCISFTSDINGDMYHTGAKTYTADISSLGNEISFTLAISDVGDEIYVSVLLLDNVRFQ